VLASAVFQSEITSFVVDSSRSRKMILLNDVSGRLVLSDSGECAGKIISVNPRSRGWRGSRFTSR
jgi:hypothetical protein